MSLLGLIDLLKEQPDSSQQDQFLELMEKSVNKMDRYIQTTLEYYRNLKAATQIVEVHIGDLLTEIIDSLRTYNRIVDFRVKHEGNATVATDKIRLKVILNNLISNAVKYGNKGQDGYVVEIETKGSEFGLEIIVRDYGKGIAKDKIDKIFDMFFKDSESQDKRSTGLGLYLVKEAIKKIDGKISVDSEEGRGSTFTVKIPTHGYV